MENVTAIILAAGKGTRMQSTDTNKVAMHVKGEPMLTRTIKVIRDTGIKNIVVVVGFAKDSVISLLDQDVKIAEQKEQLGTGHAVVSALSKVPESTSDVFIVYGDDSFLYNPEIFNDLYKLHKENNAKVSFLTMDSDSPTGFGRIKRNENNEVIGIVEEKNATDEERLIKEINLGCYFIDKPYLTQNIDKINKNELTGEYYITDIIDIVSRQNEKIAALKLTGHKWQGVNTRDDLIKAESLI